MASTIDVARIVQFGENFRHRVQEMGSVFRGIFDEVEVIGKRRKIDFLGSSETITKTGRNQAITYIDPAHTARWLSSKTDYWSALVDKEDILRVLADPKSKYMESGVMAINRHFDNVVIDAFNASVPTGEDADGSQAFLAANQIAAGSTGLTIAKLRQALRLLEQGGFVHQSGDMLFAVLTPKQKENLLATTEVGSQDFNSVRALVNGDVDTFMGFKFLTSTLLDSGDGLGAGLSTDREVYCFSNRAMMVGIGRDMITDINEQTQLVSHPFQVYLEHDIGAVRMQEELIVQIDCDETV